MAAQGAFGTDFYDSSILRPKHSAYYRSGRPVIKIGPKGALGSHEIRPIHSAPRHGQSIVLLLTICWNLFEFDLADTTSKVNTYVYIRSQ